MSRAVNVAAHARPRPVPRMIVRRRSGTTVPYIKALDRPALNIHRPVHKYLWIGWWIFCAPNVEILKFCQQKFSFYLLIIIVDAAGF